MTCSPAARIKCNLVSWICTENKSNGNTSERIESRDVIVECTNVRCISTCDTTDEKSIAIHVSSFISFLFEMEPRITKSEGLFRGRWWISPSGSFCYGWKHFKEIGKHSNGKCVPLYHCFVDGADWQTSNISSPPVDTQLHSHIRMRCRCRNIDAIGEQHAKQQQSNERMFWLKNVCE